MVRGAMRVMSQSKKVGGGMNMRRGKPNSPNRTPGEADSANVTQADLAAMRKQLREVSQGQAALYRTMAKVDEKISSLLCKEGSGTADSVDQQAREKIVSVDGEEAETVEDRAEAETVEVCEEKADHNGEDNAEESPSELFARLTAADTRKDQTIDKLQKLIAMNDEAKKRDKEYNRKFREASLFSKFEMLNQETKQNIVDCVVAFFIFSNSIFIGISADNWQGEIDVYCFIDLFFSIVFLTELMMKFHVLGCKGFFYGEELLTNNFDFLLVTLDSVQLMLVFFATDLTRDMEDAGIPSASLFRTVRLLRIARILRLLRHPAFQDLLAMMEGLIMGATTLTWAVALFVLILYVMALLCNSMLPKKGTGNLEEHEKLQPYFSSVSRSMYTVFRCSFGDCSTQYGQPISEFINSNYGAAFSLFYSLFMFVMIIGLFNVISAIFVDATMTRAAEIHINKQFSRLSNETLWATCVTTVVRRFLIRANRVSSDMTEYDHIDASMLQGEIDRSVVEDVVQSDTEVHGALHDLDIDPHDHDKLADILDPDHSGTIGFGELVNGLYRLRGQPRRSDIVTVDLMLRATQEKLDDIHILVIENAKTCSRMANLLTPDGHHARATVHDSTYDI